MLDPLIKTIEVPCGQKEAFVVFVNEVSTWCPLGKYSVSAFSGEAARSIRVEPTEGGQIVEIGHDHQEHLWGIIRSYDPHDSIGMDFHIPEPGDTSGAATRVDVRFTALAHGLTRVELTQSNWEALGDKAVPMRGGYGGGWAEIFQQAYKAACAL